MAPSGLYARLCHAFLVFIYFFTRSKAISVSTGPIFTFFSPNGRYLRKFSWSGPDFPILQGKLPWQPILCRKQNTNHVRFFSFFTLWKHFGCRWWIWNFFSKMRQNYLPPCIYRSVILVRNVLSLSQCAR